MTDTVEVEKQLMTLKVLTQNSGVLHELQTQHLIYWGMMAVEQAKDTPEIGWGFAQKLVEFNFKKLGRKLPDDFQKKCDIMTESVRWLLGDDFSVRIRNDKKVIYRNTPSIQKRAANGH